MSTSSQSLLRRLLPLWIILLALAVAATLVLTRSKAEPVKVAEKAWLVGVQEVVPAQHAPSLTLYGKVESLWSSQLTAGLSADVLAVKVIEGDAVQQGTLLVQLDEREAQLLVAQREADLREALAKVDSEQTRHKANLDAVPRERKLLMLTRNEVRRLQDLVAKKVSAQSALDTARQAAERQAITLVAREQTIAEHAARLAEAQARVSRAEALRNQALLELDRCQIKAPFNARVSRVLVSPGKRVRNGDPLIQLYDTDALVVRAQLPNRYLPIIREAFAAGRDLRVQGKIDGQPVTARLRSLAGEVARGSGGVEGLFELDVAPGTLQQGRFVRLDLALPPMSGLVALPHEALYGDSRVYQIDPQSRLRPLRVERIGEQRLSDGGTQVLVRSDEITAGTRLLVTQLPNAIEGLLVRVAGETAQ